MDHVGSTATNITEEVPSYRMQVCVLGQSHVVQLMTLRPLTESACCVFGTQCTHACGRDKSDAQQRTVRFLQAPHFTCTQVQTSPEGSATKQQPNQPRTSTYYAANQLQTATQTVHYHKSTVGAARARLVCSVRRDRATYESRKI